MDTFGRVVMLGRVPDLGKSSVARYLLKLAESRPGLLQWDDVGALWLHQPWRGDERMTAMMRANLRAVADHAAHGGVDTEMHRLITSLLPAASTAVSVQLHAARELTGIGQAARFAQPPGSSSSDWAAGIRGAGLPHPWWMDNRVGRGVRLSEVRHPVRPRGWRGRHSSSWNPSLARTLRNRRVAVVPRLSYRR